MESGEGRIFELFHILRDDISLDFLNTIVNVHNSMVKSRNKDEIQVKSDKLNFNTERSEPWLSKPAFPS